LLVSKTKIQDDETAGELHDRLAEMAPPVVLEALRQLAAGTAIRIPQDNAQATYAPKLQKSDGVLDWTQSADELARRVRAMNPWPGAMTAALSRPRPRRTPTPVDADDD
jgi:methionyl-tRNA formyltransferase